MTFSKYGALTACLALLAPAASAQTTTLDGLENMHRSALSPIYAGNEVKGYLMYARGEQADRRTDNYLLDFYDQDLAKVSTVTIPQQTGVVRLVSNSFNGSAFAFYFYNFRNHTFEMQTYGTGLKQLATKTIGSDLVSATDQRLVQNQVMPGSIQLGIMGSGAPLCSGMNLFPVPGQGFVRNSYSGLAKGYELVMYDDKLNPKWTLTSEKGKIYEIITLTEATDKYLLGSILRRDNVATKKIDAAMVAIDATTGKKVLDLPIETDPAENLTLSSFTFDAGKREFVAMGEYYSPTDKPFVHKSQGFYLKRFSETGQLLSAKTYAWQQEVAALLPAEARASMEGSYVNYTHSIVRGADGKMYVVMEQFKIAVSAGSVALKLLGSPDSANQGEIGNLFIFEIDPQSKLTNVRFYPKPTTYASLPNGIGIMRGGLLGGRVLKAQGGFDYQFMGQNDGNTQFNAVYRSFDAEKGAAVKPYIGSIAFGDNGKYTLDKIGLTGGTATTYLYPAKPGFVMIADYYSEKKQLNLKLVKLNI